MLSAPGLRDRWDFARHLRARQVWTRCMRMAKRRILQRWPALADDVPTTGAVMVANAPLSAFGPHAGCENPEPGRFRFAFLGKEREFSIPFDWHRAELNVGNRLWKLNLHYMEYLAVVDDANFMALVDDWIRGNPAYQPGYWMDSWNSYTLSIRVVTWMQQLAARQGRLASDFVRHCGISLAQQLRFLRANLEFDVGGNHLVKNLRALAWAARALRDPEASACRALLESILPSQLDEQILSDGLHYERSPAYHSQVFADLLDVHLVLSPGALRDSLARRLRDMAAALADTTHPDGFVSLLNDGGLHYSHAPAACLAVFARLVGDAPVRRGIALHSAGYFGVRHGDVYLLADAGAIGPDFLVAHSHADTLTFELSVANQRLVVDAGVFEYGAGEMRAYGRGTRAHNTVTVDGIDSSAVFGEFRVGRRARASVAEFHESEGEFRLVASHDGYAHLPGSPRVWRSWRYADRCLEVRDDVRGGRGQLLESRLLFHPDVRVTARDGGAVAQVGGVMLELETEMPIEITEATYSPDMGVRLPARQVVMRVGRAPASGSYRLRVAA